VAVVPARHASSRFPGKPLIDLDGLPMIVRVAHQVERAEKIDRVVVATDDDRIRSACERFGVVCVMTPPECPSGTDRVAYAYRELGETFDFVVNVQGDEPLIDPRDVDVLVRCLEARPDGIATLARPSEALSSPHVVKVVTAPGGGPVSRALYFSRAPLAGALQHVGIYGFSPALLDRFVSMEPSRLERAERLEQLRALEAGIPIYVSLCVSERPSIGVDTPEDVEIVLQELRKIHGS
jgi:3-deoxy-manno-octulosonate cytidylyltransferase (CMP-KDO synthetase)